MATMGEKIGYVAFRAAVLLIQVIPFQVLYAVSSFLAFILHRVVRYRKKVIRKNMQYALDVNGDELSRLERNYYQNVADLALESLKAFTISFETLSSRFTLLNPDLMNRYAQRSVIIVAGHVGNWEWGAMLIDSFVPQTCLGIYKPLTNPLINEYAKYSRGRFGTQLVSMKETRKAMDQYQNSNYALILASDQNPRNGRMAIPADLFGRKTLFSHGLDDIARDNNLPIIYADIEREGRGQYTLTLIDLVSEPQTHKRGEITQLFATQLESIIRNRKDDWLWSHKRWKRVSDDFYN